MRADDRDWCRIFIGLSQFPLLTHRRNSLSWSVSESTIEETNADLVYSFDSHKLSICFEDLIDQSELQSNRQNSARLVVGVELMSLERKSLSVDRKKCWSNWQLCLLSLSMIFTELLIGGITWMKLFTHRFLLTFLISKIKKKMFFFCKFRQN